MAPEWWLVLDKGLRSVAPKFCNLQSEKLFISILYETFIHCREKNFSISEKSAPYMWNTRVFWFRFKGHCNNLIPSADAENSGTKHLCFILASGSICKHLGCSTHMFTNLEALKHSKVKKKRKKKNRIVRKLLLFLTNLIANNKLMSLPKCLICE